MVGSAGQSGFGFPDDVSGELHFFLCDAGRGHFDISEQTASYIALFLKKSLDARYPSAQPVDRPVKLKPVRVKDGWLAERWRADGRKRAKPAPYALYRGDRHDAFWYFDRGMAELTERRYKESEGKKMQYLGVVQHGKLLEYDPKLHAGIVMDFCPRSRWTDVSSERSIYRFAEVFFFG